jgi:transcriptional/translational regulatory protein YebC/TACO1
VTTDNAKRTVADIRHLFTRFDGKLGTTGSVAHLFEKRGELNVPAAKYDEDTTLEAALDAGALAAEVTRLWADPARRRQAADAGRRRAHDFSWDAHVDAVLVIVREVAGRRAE